VIGKWKYSCGKKSERRTDHVMMGGHSDGRGGVSEEYRVCGRRGFDK